MWGTAEFTRFVAVTVAFAAILMGGSAQAEDYRLNFPPILTMSPKGVNVQTGRFDYSQKEFSIGPLSVDLRYTSKTYNDVYAFTTIAPSKIDFPVNGVARSLRGTVDWESRNDWQGTPFEVLSVRIGDSLLQYTYTGTWPNPTFTPWNLEAVSWKVVKSGSNYTATNKSGDVYTFVDHAALPTNSPHPDRVKLLSNAVFADGHRLDYSYGTSAELRTVTSNKGFAVVFDYVSATQTITACGYNLSVTYVDANSTCAAATLKTSYAFSNASGNLRLISATDTGGNVSNWTYAGTMLDCITFPASATCRFQNSYGNQPGETVDSTMPDQVRKQTMPTGEIWLYTYSFPQGGDQPPLLPGQVRTTYGNIYDPLGNHSLVQYKNGVASAMTTPAGTVTYTFNGLCPLSITYPEGNALQFVSSNSCNIGSKTAVPKPGSPLSSTIVSVAYPAELTCDFATRLCDKPTSKTDELGRQTDYTFDTANGQILTETLPAIGGIRPQTRFTYAQRYAWVKNSGGTYVQAATPVWVLTQKSICKSGAASGAGCVTPSDEVRTTYDYGPNSGPNNLFLRGTVEDSTGAALRTCYGYDWRGNKVSETRPRAGLASCP